MSSEAESREEFKQQTLVDHLTELRNRLQWMLLAWLLVLLAAIPFARQLYALLAQPLIDKLPEGTSMIATDPAAPFFVPFKFAMVVSLFVVMPVWLYHAWAFVAPGLYRNERGVVQPLVISSSLLFYVGLAFAYYVAFPLIFGFLTAAAPEGVTVMTDITSYLGFVLKLFFAFGVAFEVPVATVLLVMSGAMTRAELAAKRPYVIVVAFVVGMLLTPPDVVSQILLAVPMWILFEAGLVMSGVMRRRMAEPEIGGGADPDLNPEEPESDPD
ncbi:MAG: twin-arginine translocase subunit TatC [Gammaproteobacteria bacterium]|nr:twin-arginine translocase subunit TatC [Gammaproteobacteria bacterium]